MELTIMVGVIVICATILIGMGMLVAYSVHENKESRKMVKEIMLGLQKSFDKMMEDYKNL